MQGNADSSAQHHEDPALTKQTFFQRLFGGTKHATISGTGDRSAADISSEAKLAIRAGRTSRLEFYLPEIVQTYQKRFGDVPTRTYRTTVEDMMREFTEPDIVKIVDEAVIPRLSELGLARDYDADALRMHFRNKPDELFAYAENLSNDAVQGLAERGAEIAGVRLVVGPDTAEAKEVSGPNQAPAAPSEQHEICYGIPVPGKPGFVVSPYSPNAGFIDVRDYSPDSEVKDTATGRVFLVPPAFSTTAEVEVVGWEMSGQQSKVRLGNNTDTPLSGPFWLVGYDEQGNVCFKQPLDLPEPIPAAGQSLTPVSLDSKDHQRVKTWRVGPR